MCHNSYIIFASCDVDDVTNDIITLACAVGHVTFWYKKGSMQWLVGSSYTQDIQVVGPLEARTSSDASGASL